MRLKQPNQSVTWEHFVRLYSPLIFHWAKKTVLQAEDAADLVQDVLTTLLQKMADFDYEKGRSFRAWLKTITLNHWRDRLKRRRDPYPGQLMALTKSRTRMPWQC